ncbi:MAG: hypothetical protein ACREUY_04120 [Burkholderiales bacterium]
MATMMLLLSALVYSTLGEQTANLQKTNGRNGLSQKIGQDVRNPPAGRDPQPKEISPEPQDRSRM